MIIQEFSFGTLMASPEVLPSWPVNSYALPYDRFPAGAITEVLIGAAYN